MGLDEQLFRALNQAGQNLGLDLLMVAFTFIGMSYILVMVAPALWWSKRREAAFDIVILVIVSDILSEVLKVAFDRPRPFETLADVRMLDWGWLTSASSPSFPSGHALRAFAVGVYLLYSTHWKYRVPALAVPAFIGISRIYLGLHWPSDIVGGAVVGAALAVTIHWLAGKEGRYKRTRARVISGIHRKFNPGTEAGASVSP